MKRFVTLTLTCLTIVLYSMAQDNMRVVSFSKLENDLTANTRGTMRLDQNGETAALIKIQTPERGFTFDGGTLGIVATEEHDGELWLYVPRRAQKLIVQHRDYGVMRDFTYPIPIEGGRTYEMFIDLGIGRYVTITSQLANSQISIDGVDCGTAPVNNHYLHYGRHIVRAVKNRHEGEQMITIMPNDDNKVRLIQVSMQDMSRFYGDVIVTVDNQADIFFNGQNMGTGQWKTQLREGDYTVETRKADSDPSMTSFTVTAQQQNTIYAHAPVPHTGWLNIYTRPRNTKSSPFDVSGTQTLPIGTYQLEFSRKGYVTQRHEYTVRRNETTCDTVTLERVKYVKPLAFYFGGGYAIRTMGGLTALMGAVFQRHDVQAHYTFGLVASQPVHAYSIDGNDNYLSTLSYKQSSFGLKYGYQFNLMRQLAITPQVGFVVNRLTGTVDNGNGLYADGASANCVTVGVKLLLAPFQHCYIFAAPEYDVAVGKDDNYQGLTNVSNVTAVGFVATVGVIVNF